MPPGDNAGKCGPVADTLHLHCPSLCLQFNLLGAGHNASHRGAQADAPLPTSLLPSEFKADIIPMHEAGSVRRLIHTRVGDGPRVLHAAGDRDAGDAAASLLGSDGMPVRLQRNKRT